MYRFVNIAISIQVLVPGFVDHYITSYMSTEKLPGVTTKY